jgi:hypothetical protein
LGLAPSIVLPLMSAANHSLAATTWGSYATAERHIARVQKATGLRLAMPFSLQSTLAYVGFLLAPRAGGGRELKGKSVEKYMSGLRMAHMQRGHFAAWIRPDIIKLIIKGACNRDQLEKRMAGKGSKHAMTPDLMWSLKLALSRSDMKLARKRIIWAVSTMCWAGAMRIHEVLARDAMTYDPLTTMTGGDITAGAATVEGKMVETLKVYLKHPKEERLSDGVVIDLFESGDFMCPIKAHKSWLRDKGVKLSGEGAMFRLEGGRNYTGAEFNKDLKVMLRGVVDYSVSPVTSHSFRRGLATFMAKNGYEDSDIMKIGRWHSDAFKSYIATPREVRGRLARELAEKVARAMTIR